LLEEQKNFVSQKEKELELKEKEIQLNIKEKELKKREKKKRNTKSENYNKIVFFINEKYEITEDSENRVYRGDFVDLYNEYYNDKIKWIDMIGDVKQILNYDRQKRVNGKQGVIIGIKNKNEQR